MENSGGIDALKLAGTFTVAGRASGWLRRRQNGQPAGAISSMRMPPGMVHMRCWA